MKIFLDIGAHIGQSALVAMRPKYGFDKIYSFEPDPRAHSLLVAATEKDPRVTPCRFGLFNKDGRMDLFNAFGKGASLYYRPAKYYKEPTIQRVTVRKASSWFVENLSRTDKVYAKFNCEGSEIFIINDLLESGEFERIFRSLVRLDALKIPELAENVAEFMPRIQPFVESGAVALTGIKPVGLGQYSLLENWLDEVIGDSHAAD